MVIYKFGVMSSVWTLEAENITIAKLAMILLIQTTLPIAIYKPIENKEAFIPSFGFMKKHFEYKPEEVKKAYETIKEYKNG